MLDCLEKANVSGIAHVSDFNKLENVNERKE